MQLRVVACFEVESISGILSLVTEEEFVRFFKYEYADCWDGFEEWGFNVRSKEDLIERFWDLDIPEGDIVDSILSVKDGMWAATWVDDHTNGLWVVMKLEVPPHLDKNNIIYYSK